MKDFLKKWWIALVIVAVVFVLPMLVLALEFWLNIFGLRG